MTLSLAQQIEEIDYELGQRRGVYGRLVASGKMRQAVADYHMHRLEAARRTLDWLAQHEGELKAFLKETPTTRQAALSLAVEIARREALAGPAGAGPALEDGEPGKPGAPAGGPVR
jgi:hypothetical protein